MTQQAWRSIGAIVLGLIYVAWAIEALGTVRDWKWDWIRQQSMVKMLVVLALKLATLPLSVILFTLWSAWIDARDVSVWLRPRAICEHGVDRNRRHCQPCSDKEQRAMFEEAAPPHEHFRCPGCGETFCATGERGTMIEGDACPVCHIDTVKRVAV